MDRKGSAFSPQVDRKELYMRSYIDYQRPQVTLDDLPTSMERNMNMTYHQKNQNQQTTENYQYHYEKNNQKFYPYCGYKNTNFSSLQGVIFNSKKIRHLRSNIRFNWKKSRGHSRRNFPIENFEFKNFQGNFENFSGVARNFWGQ